jgi:aryl-alcohol dehydrogenase-like predicted oxidoreductase
MRRRVLGSSGMLVSEFTLGAMTFGAETPEDETHAILDAFVEAGGDTIDCADVYAEGRSEEQVGRWMESRGNRDELVILTKGRFRVGPDAGHNDFGLSRRHLVRALDASLRRLGVDHVDLYQVHAWDPHTPPEQWLVTLDDMVRAGKVREVGVSNLNGWQLQRAVMIARQEGLAPIVSLQPQYNLLAREVEWELVDLCALEGLGLLPWSPLGGGWLTGKYGREVVATTGGVPSGATRLGEDPDRGVEAWSKRDTDRVHAIVDEVIAVAHGRGVTPSQVALTWVNARRTVASTILGVRTLAQLRDNVGAAGLELSAEETARLDAVSEPQLPDYPYGFISRAAQARFDALGSSDGPGSA